MSKHFEPREGDGALFKNEERETEQQPLYRGSIRIGGQDYWLSAWLKESKAGKKYMSLSAQPKRAQDYRGAPKNPPAEPSDKFDDDDKLPF
jgi:hypothetical protein